MSTCTVALLQIAAAGADPDANLATGERACRDAAALGADIALFPEMWSTGYEWSGAGGDVLAAQAVDRDGRFVNRFRELAAELGMAIAITFLESRPGGPRNTVTLIDRRGRDVLTYAKVHTCDFDAERVLTRGDGFATADLDTAAGPVRVGAMICFDVLFPESARVLMLQGAEIVLVPNASANDANHLVALRARAHENMVGVALANYPEPEHGGRSAAFDAVAYTFEPDPDPGRPVDPTLVMAGGDEGIHLAHFDLDRMRAFRTVETQGDAYRRPGAYGLLLTARAAPPFVRPDARR
jgi:predicted amidohydrolase